MVAGRVANWVEVACGEVDCGCKGLGMEDTLGVVGMDLGGREGHRG